MQPEYEVRIPKSVKPKFPAICVSCGVPSTTSFRVATESTGWWAFFPGMWIYAHLTGRAIQVPACDGCIGELRRERRLRTIIEWGVVIIGVALGLWIFRDWSGLAKRFAILGVAIVIALPYIAWDVLFPAAVGITVTDNTVYYTFRNKHYADAFATKNAIIS